MLPASTANNLKVFFGIFSFRINDARIVAGDEPTSRIVEIISADNKLFLNFYFSLLKGFMSFVKE
jgi:hypothetical protein